jgi:preprotein translocase subunit SecE
VRVVWKGRRSTVPDVAFVLLTVALFGVLLLVVRGAEKL